MKIIFILLITLLPFTGFGQELLSVRDTINQFEVGVPVGWRYGVPENKSVNFITFGQKLNESDVPRETYNIFLRDNEEEDINKTYKLFTKSLSIAENFQIVAEGDTVINNRNYKWVIETHSNKYSGEVMKDYVLFTNNSGRVLVLTMATIESRFDQFKPLFDKIAASLKY